MALLRISPLFLLLGAIIVSMLLLTNCSSFLPPSPSSSAFYHLLDRFLLHHYPLLICALLHLTLFALHFSAASGSSPQRAGSESSSESFPAELFLISDAAADFDPLPAPSTAGATVADHKMSLDELHRRIEEFFTRARSNMRAEARSEGPARRSPSTAHLLKNSSRMQALPRLRGQARIVMHISGNKISQS